VKTARIFSESPRRLHDTLESFALLMELPQHYSNPLFVCSDKKTFLNSLSESTREKFELEINSLVEKGLPPIVNLEALCVLTGFNPGLFRSFLRKKDHYYRTFTLPKGSSRRRRIAAPRVFLKAIQKWISLCLNEYYVVPPHVHGFVSGKSNVTSALVHRSAAWAVSVDIESCFDSTKHQSVRAVFNRLGYPPEGAKLLTSLCTLGGRLPQGAPSSPVLLNLCMLRVDKRLQKLSRKLNVEVTRYADDIVFSSPTAIEDESKLQLLNIDVKPWRLNPLKSSFTESPKRLKVNGLLVGGGRVRLTKGYRNRIRLMKYSLSKITIESDPERFKEYSGHIAYATNVKKLTDE